MVQDSDVHQRQRVLEAPGNELIGLARLGDAARVRVGKDDRGGVPLQGFLDDFPRVDRCAVDRASEQLDEVDDPVTIVYEDAAEGFELPAA